MIPPLIPINVVPVTTQHDPVKPLPQIAPVTAAQPNSNESTIDLRHRDPEETALRLREEQRRQQQEQQQQRREAALLPQDHAPLPGDEVNADNTVPVAPLIDGEARQGLWVDVQV